MFFLSSVCSTNQYLIDRIFDLKSGDVCIAKSQTQGRGRLGKKWISCTKNNIYLSMYWRILKTSVLDVRLSLKVSIIIAELLRQFGVNNIRVKWPNDIYFNNRKLAGVLIEVVNVVNSYFFHVIIGIGINLLSFNKPENKGLLIDNSWISLQDFDIIIDRNLFISRLIFILRRKLQKFESVSFFVCFVFFLTLDICI